METPLDQTPEPENQPNPELLEEEARQTHYISEEERQEYLKLNIPLWVKIFGSVVALLVIISLFNLPKTLLVGIKLARIERKIKEKRYLTAQNEAIEVLKTLPGNKQAKCKLMLASFYNNDMVTFYNTSKDLVGVTFTDDENDLYNELNGLVEKAGKRVPSDSLYSLGQQYDSGRAEMPDTTWERYIKDFPDDLQASTAYAGILIDKDKYAEAEALLKNVLQKENDNLLALMLASGCYRQTGDINGSMECCNKMLEINKELTYAMSSKARNMLKQKKDKDALSLSQEAYKLNDKDYYTLATLVLALHFNSKTTERDKLISSVKNDTLAMESLQFALDVISHKEPFRN